MQGAEAVAILMRHIRKMETDCPFPSAEDDALKDALEAGVNALRLMGKWEEFIFMEEGEE